jgi:hypothetical protein
MAGGEFRLRTDSIYMAGYRHIEWYVTVLEIYITWLHMRGISGYDSRLPNGLTVKEAKGAKLWVGPIRRIGFAL